MISHSNSITRTLSVLAAIIGLITTITVPAGYFLIAYRYMAGSINAESEFSARAIEELVANNPNSWQFGEVRLQEILQRRLDDNSRDTWTIRGLQGQIIAQVKESLMDPVLTISQPIYDSGKKVAHIEIKRSILPLVSRTAIIAACSFVIGIMIFLILYIFPLRAVKEAYRALVFSNIILRTQQESSIDGILVVDEKGVILSFNQRFLDMWGIPPEVIESKSDERTLQSVMDKLASPEEFVRKVKHLYEVWDEVSRDEVFLKDGRVFDRYSAPMLSTDRKYFGRVWYFRDTTERKRMEETLRESEERYRILVEHSNDGVALVEGDQHKYVNQKFLDIFGYDKPEDIIGKSPFITVHPDDREVVLEYNRKRQIGEPVPSKYEFRGIKRDGTTLFVEVSVARIIYSGKPVSLACLRDMTERKRLEEQLHTMSLTDELTGLYNRRGFITLSEQQLKISERTKKGMLLLFVDLDRMKQINDTFGHQEGDKALTEIATILKEVFRESDIIGRIGGDEFAILAIDATDENRDVLIHRLYHTLDHYNKPDGRTYRLSLSMGIVYYSPEAPCPLDKLMAQADALMYEEKRNKQH
jgi:diguanylate cyclase (GGDEF)-like protein/PAS domain S-box-containing protein